MKKIFTIIAIILFLSNPVYGANTNSLNFVLASSQYATAADSVSLSFTGNFTIEFWIKAGSFASQQTVINKGDPSVNNDYTIYTLGGANAGKIYIIWQTNASAQNSQFYTAEAVPTSTWTHVAIACTVATPTCAFYFNGVLKTTIPEGTLNATSVNNSTYLLWMGARNYGAAPMYLDGKLDDVRIWSVVRTATQILNNYNIETTDTTGLVAYWKLNDSALDETANDNDLTLVNGATYSSPADPAWSEGGAAEYFDDSDIISDF